MKKIIVAYRNNALFQEYVPGILAQIPAGVEIKQNVFPAGTNPSNIREKLESSLREEEIPFVYLSDFTCGLFRLKCEALLQKERNKGIVYRYLDEAFYKIVQKMYKSRDFSQIFKAIALATSKNPSVVCVVVDNILDHLYGFKDASKMMNKYGHRALSPDPVLFAEFILGVLKETYREVEICAEQTLKSALFRYGEDENAIIVADRHCGIYEEMSDYMNIASWQYKARLFILPFETTVHHLVQQDKLEEKFDISALCDVIFDKITFA